MIITAEMREWRQIIQEWALRRGYMRGAENHSSNYCGVDASVVPNNTGVVMPKYAGVVIGAWKHEGGHIIRE